jgi:hypothetical protein
MMISSETGARDQIRPPERSGDACFGIRRSDGERDFGCYFGWIVGFTDFSLFMISS